MAARLFLFALLVASLAPLAEAQSLRVGTFNLRYANSSDPHVWSDRVEVAVELIQQQQLDVFGTQEGLYGQVKDLQEKLPEHRWIGLGRDGGSRGEFMAVFYRADRLEPLEFDHYWLSDTPDVIGSTTWGNSNRRMVTWIKFRDLEADETFYFINTHWDHQVQAARIRSAELMRQRVSALTSGVPVVLVGDFNALAGRNPAYEALVGDGFFQDAWSTAENQGEAVNTFHGWQGPTPGDRRIDWILLRGPVRALDTEIVTYNRDGVWPSDHFPVVATLQWADTEPSAGE